MNERTGHTSDSNFPTAVFPNFPEWKHGTKRKRGLQGYGSWEAIDIEVVKDREIVHVKKSRPSSLLPAGNFTVLTPCRDQEILCEQNLTERDCNLLDDINITKRLTPKVFDRKFRCTVFPIEEKFLRSVEGSSKILTRDFGDFLKTNSTDSSLRKWMKYNLKMGMEDKMLLSHFDPTCFGIGRKLFSDLLQEDCKHSLKDYFNDEGAVSGGCLSYRHLRQSNDGNLGVIISVEGDGFHELSMKAIFTKSGQINSPQLPNSSERQNLSIEVCGEIAQTLNEKIRNIDSVSGNDSAILISAMSEYHVLFNSLRGNKITFNWEDKEATFSENSVTSSLLKTSRPDPFASVVLNPYIDGECVVATKSGLTGLWKADIQSHSDAFDSILRLNAKFKRKNVCFKQISFGAHPRQFFGCDQNCVYLFDVRSQNSPSCLFDASNSPYLVKSEHIHASQSCKPIGSEYEILVATDNSIFIFDQRYSHQPLLKWSAVTDFPACYFKCLAAPRNTAPSDITGSNCQLSNSLLLTGGMTTDKVYYYQMSRLNKSINDKQCSYAPFSVAPPRILCQSPTEPTDYNTKLQHSMSTHKYLKHVISGFDGFALEGHESSGVCVFQLTSNGEIFYQTLDGNKNESEDCWNGNRQQWENVRSEATGADSASTTNDCATSPRLQNSFSTINCYLSETTGEHCVLCRPENVGIYASVSDNECGAESTSAEPCNHRSFIDRNRLMYDVTDSYFHNQTATSELHLINLNAPNEPSDLGKMLLESWDEPNE